MPDLLDGLLVNTLFLILSELMINYSRVWSVVLIQIHHYHMCIQMNEEKLEQELYNDIC